MARLKEGFVKLKKMRVGGVQYTVPESHVEIEKLVQKGISLQSKMKAIQDDLEAVKIRLTEIGRGFRESGATSVKMEAITGGAVVTFRETWEAVGDVKGLGQDLGPAYDIFFEQETKWKATKALSTFMDGQADGYGFTDPDAVRELLAGYVKRKVIKPNVKIVPIG